MNLKGHPTEIASTLLERSICAVQVAAVLVDNWGIHAWGWNSAGPTGLGEHAEAHCLRRANRKRVKDSILYVAARRKRNNRWVTAKPCPDCQKLIEKYGCAVVWRDDMGMWRTG